VTTWRKSRLHVACATHYNYVQVHRSTYRAGSIYYVHILYRKVLKNALDIGREKCESKMESAPPNFGKKMEVQMIHPHTFPLMRMIRRWELPATE
jgi:hypothetical protein